MAPIPQSVLDAIQRAKDSQEQARVVAEAHIRAVAAVNLAQDNEKAKVAEFNAASNAAMIDAQAAVTALCSDLGL